MSFSRKREFRKKIIMSDEQKQVPEKFKALVEQIEKLSVLDLAELVKVLEEKFGVSAAPTLAVGAPTSGVGAAPVEEEKTSFNVELTDAGATKINVIKVVREATGLGLADSKAIVDSAPKMVKEGVDKATAEDLKKKIEAAGGKATLK